MSCERHLVRVAIAAVLLASAAPSAAIELDPKASRPFVPAYATTQPGAVVGLGNTVLGCEGQSGCAEGNNNNFDMQFIDVDGDPATFDSSTATLVSASAAGLDVKGRQILAARLYWSANIGGSDGSRYVVAKQARDGVSGFTKIGALTYPDIDLAGVGRVLLRGPGDAAYSTLQVDDGAQTCSLTSSAAPQLLGRGRIDHTRTDASNIPGRTYTAVCDVTALLRARGDRSVLGTWTAADVQAGRGNDRHGAWTLVVIYADSSLPYRNMAIYDGLINVQVAGGQAGAGCFGVSGFIVPPTGPLNAFAGLVAYEGDRTLTGDHARLQASPTLGDPDCSNASTWSLLDHGNPQNYFDSSITGSVFDRGPQQDNNHGYDLHRNSASSFLARDSRRMDVAVDTVGDTYFVHAAYTQIDVYSPHVTVVKTVENRTHPGELAQAGDKLRYTLTVANHSPPEEGAGTARGVVLTDEVPAGTSIVANSLGVLAGANQGDKTDAAGDDQGEVADGRVTFRLGTGADAANGGALADGESTTVRFDVRIAPTHPPCTVENVATVRFDASLGRRRGVRAPSQEVEQPSNVVVTPVSCTTTVTGTLELTDRLQATYPWTLTKTATPPQLVLEAGQTGSFSYTVTAVRGEPGDLVGSVRGTVCLQKGAGPPTEGLAVTVVLKRGGRRIAGPVPVDFGELGSTERTCRSGSYVLPADETVEGATYTAEVTVAFDNSAAAEPTTLTASTVLGPAASRPGSITVADTGQLGSGTHVFSGPDAPPWTYTHDASCSDPARDSRTYVNTAAINGQDGEGSSASATVTVTCTPPPAPPLPLPLPPAGANLSVTKTAPAAVDAGADIPYVVTVTNAGPATAEGVTLTDAVPTAVTLVPGSVVPSQGTCTQAVPVSCALGSLAAGARATVRFSATSSLASLPSVTNEATVTTTTPGDDPADNHASATTAIRAADLSVLKTGTRAARIGQTVTYRIAVRNRGPSDEPNAMASDTLPDGLVGVAVVPSQGTCVIAGGKATCELGLLPGGATARITITGAVAGTATIGLDLQDVVVVSGDLPEANPGDERSRASTRVLAPPERPSKPGGGGVAPATLVLRKRAVPAEVEPGDTVTFTLTVANPGPTPLLGTIVCDSLPDGLVLVSAPGSRMVAGRPCWTMRSMHRRGQRTFTFTARATDDATGTLRNVAVATALNATPTRASASVRVTEPSGAAGAEKVTG